MAKLDRQDVPVASFDLARERTAGLADEIGFFFSQSKYVRPGGAIGDALANAWLQGVNDAVAAIARNPDVLK